MKTEFRAGERPFTVSYRDQGSGQCVVFIHCLGGSQEMWSQQVAVLGQGRRAITYDLRGQGNTSDPGVEYAVEDLAHDTIQLLDHLGVEKASVIGLSMGGMAAQLVAARFPQRVDKLVLVNTTPYALADSMWEQRAALAEQRGLEVLADATMARLFTPEFRDRHAEEFQRVRSIFCSTDRFGFARACRALATFDARPVLASIHAPTLVVAGERDQVSPPVLGQEIADNVHLGKLVVIPEAAHLSCVEQPALFNDVVAGFLD